MKKKHFFGDYQVNDELLSLCSPNHIVLHCLPAYRGKEISEKRLWKRMLTPFFNRQKTASTSRKRSSQLLSNDHTGSR